MQISGKRDQVILKDKTLHEAVTIKDCENCIIDGCDFEYDKSDTTLLTLSNCRKCTVRNCKFHDKSTKGLFLKISGGNTSGNIVEGCEFWNHTFNDENGGEPVRIGNSSSSGCLFNTQFRKNSLHDLRADVETISIKSCGNVIEDNDFENNASMIAFRHGGFNKVRNNRFKGKGGIRLYGTGNEITDNYFKDNKDTKWVPISIENGNTERDPNFTSENKPSGKEGNSHAMYDQVIDNKITGNKFENCTKTIVFNDKGRKLEPKDKGKKLELKDLLNLGNITVKPGEVTVPPVPPEEEPVEPPEPEPEPEVIVTPEPIEAAPQPSRTSGSLYNWWIRISGGGPVAQPAPAPTTPPTTTPTPTPPTTQPPVETLDSIGNKIHILVNQERQKNGVAALAYDERLEGIAASHSKDMGVRNFFAHVTPEGYDLGKRYAQAGYTGCRAYGENIAYFETSRLSQMTYEEIAQKMFNMWLNSPPHHENMLRSMYTVEGIGMYVKENRIYGTMDFCGK